MDALPGFEVLTPRFFNEIAVRTPVPAADLVQTLADNNLLVGVPVSRLDPMAGMGDVLLMATTEVTPRRRHSNSPPDHQAGAGPMTMNTVGRPTRPEAAGDAPLNDYVHPTRSPARGACCRTRR